jgi:hypothetical protein
MGHNPIILQYSQDRHLAKIWKKPASHQDRIFTHLNVISDMKVNANNIPVLIQVKEVQQQLCDFGLKSYRISNIYIPLPAQPSFFPPERTAAMTYGMRHSY